VFEYILLIFYNWRKFARLILTLLTIIKSCTYMSKCRITLLKFIIICDYILLLLGRQSCVQSRSQLCGSRGWGNQGKWVGDLPKEHVCITAARTGGHGLVYSLKTFVARADVGKQWSPDTVNWGVNVFGDATSVIYTSYVYMKSCLEISLGDAKRSSEL
jgi:hypothetical protein